MQERPVRNPLPRVFTYEEAVRAGWTQSALRHAVRCGRLRRSRTGVYALVDHESDPFARRDRRVLDDGQAATKSVNGAVISNYCAALWHGLPVLAGDVACITLPPRSSHTYDRLHVHRAAMPVRHLVAGHPVTTVARTVVDLAREHGLRSAVVAGDAAVRLGKLRRTELDRVLRDCRGWSGTRAAQRAASLIDGRSESPLESLSRIALNAHGFDPEALQTELFDSSGNFVARVDFYLAELGVVGEADGQDKYDEDGYREKEQRRRQAIENLNLGFVRWQWSDLRRFQVIADRIRHTARHRHGPILGSTQPCPPIEW